MKLKKFKERDYKRTGIIAFTIMCILLVSGVILYRTFAIFEVRTNQNVIKGTVQDSGDIYFAFYKDNQIQKEMPKKEEGYVLDESKSYCGVTGENDSQIKVFVTEDNMIHVSGVTTSRTKCNLYFIKGAYLLGKGVPIVESGEGLYEVKHDDVSEINEGFKETEFRYAGNNPNNYVTFNNEKWRIIGLVNVLVPQVDGSEKVEQRIKIVRNESIGSYSWDSQSDGTNYNDWTKSTLMSLLNQGAYYNRTSGTYYNHNTEIPVNFSENGLLDFAKSMIEKVTWNLGGISDASRSIEPAKRIYDYERGKVAVVDRLLTWKGNIGLIYPSDYFYATGDNQNTCLNKMISEWNNSECASNDWLLFEAVKDAPDDKLIWTLMSGYDDQNDVIRILLTSVKQNAAWRDHAVYPTLYLKQNVKILNDTNNGSQEKPFSIVQIF